MDAQLVQFSKSEMVKVQATVKTQRMFKDGKNTIFFKPLTVAVAFFVYFYFTFFVY